MKFLFLTLFLVSTHFAHAKGDDAPSCKTQAYLGGSNEAVFLQTLKNNGQIMIGGCYLNQEVVTDTFEWQVEVTSNDIILFSAEGKTQSELTANLHQAILSLKQALLKCGCTLIPNIINSQYTEK